MSSVMLDAQILRTLVIPFQGGQAILPNSTVVQVLPYAKPLRLENAPTWTVGAMLWRARTIPLISLGRLVDPFLIESEESSRIVVLNTLNQRPKLSNIGMLCTEPPRLVNLTRMAINVDLEAGPQPYGVLRWVKVHSQIAMIPDLDYIETQLAPVMRA